MAETQALIGLQSSLAFSTHSHHTPIFPFAPFAKMVQIAALFTALLATVASAAVIAPAPASSNATEIAKRDVYGDGEEFLRISLFLKLISFVF